MPRGMFHGVEIDERGWYKYRRGYTPPSRRPGSEQSRCGLPWSTAEDRKLLTRMLELEREENADPMRTLAREHFRSMCSISTRICALRSGIRLAMAAKQAAEEHDDGKR